MLSWTCHRSTLKNQQHSNAVSDVASIRVATSVHQFVSVGVQVYFRVTVYNSDCQQFFQFTDDTVLVIDAQLNPTSLWSSTSPKYYLFVLLRRAPRLALSPPPSSYEQHCFIHSIPSINIICSRTGLMLFPVKYRYFHASSSFLSSLQVAPLALPFDSV